MVDRLSTYQVFTRGVSDIVGGNSQVNRTQEQIASGRRVMTPADDPVAAARILQLDEELAQTDQFLENIKSARGRLEVEEGYLSTYEDVMQKIRELTVRAGNAGALLSTDRIAIASEIDVRIDEVFNLMNSTDGGGEYLFSGFAGSTQPFEKSPGGGYQYMGDEGQRALQIGSQTRVNTSDSGRDLFVDIKAAKEGFSVSGGHQNTGSGEISQGLVVDRDAFEELYPDDVIITFNNNLDVTPPDRNFTVRSRSDNRVINGMENQVYQPGTAIDVAGMNVKLNGQPEAGDSFLMETGPNQNVLATLEQLSYALHNYDESPGNHDAYNDAIADSLTNIDNAINKVSQVHSSVGARMNSVDSLENMHMDLQLVSQSVQSELRDLDYAEAVSRLQLESFILEATQQSYVKVASLSLFNFLR
jgi:flagellar hook-associated protein 3 FlgL